jgi:hypothetical protein
MSFNPNQPYEQWQQQQQPADPNQQQLQLNTPQTTTASPASNPAAGGGGNYQQSHSWTDGNTQGQHHQSQQSWSWQGQVPVQQQITSPIVIQPPTPAFPPLLQVHSSHHLLHQQMHQNATSHFQQVQNLQQQQIADMHRNMSTFAMGSAAPVILQTQQQPQIAYHQVGSPPLTPPMQVQSISQQSYLPQPQQQAQIEYQPMTPAVPVHQVQYQNQPMPQGDQFPQQQSQVAYQPMSPSQSVQQTQYLDTVSQMSLPNSQTEQQRIEELLPPTTSTTAVQPQECDQRHIYQHQPATQQYTVSQLPQTQHAPPQVIQSPSEAPPQRMLQSQPSEHPSQTALPVSSRPHDHRLMNLERQRRTDVEDTNRAGAEIHKRLQDLEHSRTQAQQDHDAKDREVRRLQEQLASVEHQRRQDAERNSQQLADLVRSQATSPAAPSAAPFDMSALQRVVRETQARQLTAQDIERVIEEQVSKRLIGMATKQDIQNAGAQMQGALSRVPAGLSQDEVQQAVNRELNHVMQDVANRVSQQRRVAGHGQPGPRHSEAPQERVQTEFVVEELPDDAVATRSYRPRQHGGRAYRQLPPAEMSGQAAAAGPSKTTQRALSSVPNLGALGSDQSSATSQGQTTSQRHMVPATARAQITAAYAAPGPSTPAVVADSSLVTSRRRSPSVNAAPRGPRLRALESSPAATDVSESSLTRTERPIPRATTTLSEISTPRNTQRIEVPATQAHLNPVENFAPQGQRFRALEMSPASSGMSENSLARTERPISGGTMTSSEISRPQITQRTEVTATQAQLNPVANVAPQGPRLRALEASPAAPGVPEHSLARMERSLPRATLSSSTVSPPQTRQRIEVPAPQSQIAAPPVAARQEVLQQSSRRLPQTVSASTQQRQLEAPPTLSEASAGTGQELVLQGREVARNPPSKR